MPIQQSHSNHKQEPKRNSIVVLASNKFCIHEVMALTTMHRFNTRRFRTHQFNTHQFKKLLAIRCIDAFLNGTMAVVIKFAWFVCVVTLISRWTKSQYKLDALASGFRTFLICTCLRRELVYFSRLSLDSLDGLSAIKKTSPEIDSGEVKTNL